MNDADLELTITNRLRARIEAEQFTEATPGESKAEPSSVASDIVEDRIEPNNDSTMNGAVDGEPPREYPETPPPDLSPTLDDASPAPLPTNNHVLTESVIGSGGAIAREPLIESTEVKVVVKEIPPSRLELLGDDLEKRLLDIKSSYCALATQLQVAIATLSERGVPPTFLVQNALAAGHREFLKLRRDVVTKLAPLQGEAIATNRLLGLADLDDLISRMPRSPVRLAPALHAVEPKSLLVEPEAVAAHPVIEPLADLAIVATPPEPAELARENPPEEAAKSVEAEVVAAEPELPAAQPLLADSAAEESVGQDDEADSILGKAEETIDRILRIKIKLGKGPPEWEEALIGARALKRRILTDSGSVLSPETISLADGQHPLAALLLMIDQTGKLGDHEWAELYGRIEEGLGKPLAMAAARHRFMVEE